MIIEPITSIMPKNAYSEGFSLRNTSKSIGLNTGSSVARTAQAKGDIILIAFE